MFLKNRKKNPFHSSGKGKQPAYNPADQKPVLRCSICTGEQVAGFKDLHTGRFEEVMLVRNEEDLRHFKDMYGLETVDKEY